MAAYAGELTEEHRCRCDGADELMASGNLWILKDALAIIAFIIWLALNGWLWASDLSHEKLFVRSMLLAVVGYAGFFGYLAYRHRD